MGCLFAFSSAQEVTRCRPPAEAVEWTWGRLWWSWRSLSRENTAEHLAGYLTATSRQSQNSNARAPDPFQGSCFGPLEAGL